MSPARRARLLRPRAAVSAVLNIANLDSATTTFAYRGDGLRDSRTSNSTTTTFTWDIAAGLPVVIDDEGLRMRSQWRHEPSDTREL